ncbi:MAG: ABC transporter permease subunit [Mesorhizobium sp.]
MMRSFAESDVAYILLSVRWTLLLSMLALAFGGAFAALLSPLTTHPNKALRVAVNMFAILGQSTPLLMLLFLVFFGLPIIGVTVSAWWAACVGLAIHSAAFLVSIWGESIGAVPKGQSEAAEALGLSPLQTLRLVIIPQAMRIALPPTVGFCVQLIKGTSLASIIGFVELTRAGQIVNNATFEPLKVFALVAALYFAMCWPLSLLGAHLESKLARAVAR